MSDDPLEPLHEVVVPFAEKFGLEHAIVALLLYATVQAGRASEAGKDVQAKAWRAVQEHLEEGQHLARKVDGVMRDDGLRSYMVSGMATYRASFQFAVRAKDASAARKSAEELMLDGKREPEMAPVLHSAAVHTAIEEG